MAAISLSRILKFWADQKPDDIVIYHEGTTITWAELEARSNRLARAYEDLGVGFDDFVTIALSNGVEFFTACYATWKLGATPQPVSAKLPKFERDQIVEIAEPKLVVGVAPGEHRGVTTVASGYVPDPSLSDEPLEELTATSYKAMTSGGSTGRPKLIVSKHPAATDPDAEILNFQTEGSVLIPGPLYHNGPFMWAMGALGKGNQVAITTRFDAEQTLQLIESQAVDTIYMVPTMMQRIWNLPTEVRMRYDLSSLRTLWHLAAPCPVWLKEAFINWLGAEVIWELYGGTEGTGSTVLDGVEWLAHRGSVGKPTESCEMKIVGDNGETLPPGEIGEVFIRPKSGPGTTYRYIGAEAKTMEDGWESLGDVGHMDADGYLYLSDRLTDMILSGGANIYPAEVEAAIDACTGVRSSAVIGLPHTDLGSAVHAIVDVPEGNLTEQSLFDHLAQRLVRYKIPRTIEFVNQPLRDDAGKLRRKTLREERLETRQG
ncbi:MAG: AMP-binding protein [Gammaproteobacteria bacterium]|nr:AMP-binding protein [Gammaproteobacteria bacterium]